MRPVLFVLGLLGSSALGCGKTAPGDDSTAPSTDAAPSDARVRGDFPFDTAWVVHGSSNGNIALAVAPDGAIFAAGGFATTIDFEGATKLDQEGAYFARFDTNGKVEVLRSFSIDGHVARPLSIAADASGVVLVGLTTGDAFAVSPFVAAFDRDGALRWANELRIPTPTSSPNFLPAIALSGQQVVMSGPLVGPVDFGGGTIGTNGSSAVVTLDRTTGANVGVRLFGDASARAIVVDGTVVVGGDRGPTSDLGPPSADPSDLVVARLDASLGVQSAASTPSKQGILLGMASSGAHLLLTGQIDNPLTLGSATLTPSTGHVPFFASQAADGSYDFAAIVGEANAPLYAVAEADKTLLVGSKIATDSNGKPIAEYSFRIVALTAAHEPAYSWTSPDHSGSLGAAVRDPTSNAIIVAGVANAPFALGTGTITPHVGDDGTTSDMFVAKIVP